MSNYGNSFQRTTPITLNLIIINALAFFAQLVIGGATFPDKIDDLFALHHYKSEYFKPYQLITSMFMHADIGHLLFNMFGLWIFGSMLERVWGPKRFLICYFVSGVVAGLAQLANYAFIFHSYDQMVLNAASYDIYQEGLRIAITVGASGAIMGLLAAFAYLFPNTEFVVFPIPVPVKIKWLALGYAAIDILGGFYGTGSNIAHFAHLGGLAAGFVLVFIWNKTNKKTFY